VKVNGGSESFAAEREFPYWIEALRRSCSFYSMGARDCKLARRHAIPNGHLVLTTHGLTGPGKAVGNFACRDPVIDLPG
jgi:hypothetical protein